MPIRTQNACVIIRKVDEHVIVESFEVNPPNATILGTVGRLIRSFPETAIWILVLQGQQSCSPIDGPPIERHAWCEVFGGESGAPWRRSPSWLIMRVVIQSIISGTRTYEFKAFMLYFMTSVPLLGDCMDLWRFPSLHGSQPCPTSPQTIGRRT